MAAHAPRSHFGKTLRALEAKHGEPAEARQWVFIPYDQLNDGIGPLAREAPGRIGIICIETAWKPAQRRYHKQKLALIAANQRHFALEQAARGVAVCYIGSDQSYGEVLAELRKTHGTILCMEPAEHELRVNIADAVTFIKHEGWLTTDADFATLGAPPWRMDAFYRQVRRRTGILMEKGKPRGGRWSFDADNRQVYRGEPPVPALPVFKPDAITEEVGQLIATRYAKHPGTLNLTALPATKNDADYLWSWAKSACLPHFGPFEDAMTSASTNLFHTRLSPLLNIYRLLPEQIIRDVLQLPIELASLEGFIRQIIGWREFMHHVHVQTDGLRKLSEHNALRAKQPVPAAFWGVKSGLRCLDTVVESVWKEGYSHHITRLMIICNLGNLMGLNPRELTDWFWVAYIDAYDWVMDTNGMGMGLYALGPFMTTKPYVSGAAYIHRMSDYCQGCRFDPKTNCPITPMYWAFLARHENLLRSNARMMQMVRGLKRRSEESRQHDAAIVRWVNDTLASGEALEPANLP